MSAMLGGALGFIICIVVFGAGFCFGWLWRKERSSESQEEKAPTESSVSDLLAVEAKKERMALEAEQQAFRNMLNYNVDMAYGLNSMPTGKDGV